MRNLLEQGVPVRAAIRHVRGERIAPRDFGVKSIADHADLNRMWSESVAEVGSRKTGTKLNDNFQKIASGQATGKEARYVFDEVRDSFIERVNSAKTDGVTFEGYQFEQIHHWNWPISTYSSQALDATNLFSTSISMHVTINNMTTSGPKKFTPFSYFFPIAPINVR